MPPHAGALTAPEIAEGMNAAATNAQRLAEDASILLEAGRHPTAAALACLSIEESGKISILRSAAGVTDERQLKRFWRDYKSHTRKNALWPAVVLFADGANKLMDFSGLFAEHAKHPMILDRLKQSGFYTDFSQARSWIMPADAIDASIARALVSLAKIMAGKSTHTAREIELWIEHIGSVPRDNLQRMKVAVVAWYKAMQEAGLHPADDNRAEQFMTVGLHRSEV